MAFASPRLYHRMAVAMDDVGFELRDMYAWRYSRGQAKAFSPDHFVRRMPISNEEKTKDRTHVGNWQKWQTGLLDIKNVRLDGHVPTTVLEVKKPTKTYNTHLTVKPVKLLEVLIRLFTAEGQPVLDPFVGSGSTLLAARNTGREGIGIEISKEYVDIAKQRLGGQNGMGNN